MRSILVLGIVVPVPEIRCSALMLKGRPRYSKLDQNRIIAKDVKNCTYCYYVRCVTFIAKVGGNNLPPNRSNALPQTLLELPDKGRATKELAV